MEDDLIASLDIIEPPRKKFKRLVHQDQPPQSQTRRVSKRLYHPRCIKNIPREILNEILDYLDTQTIYFLTITCHHFKESNLWDSIATLDATESVRVPIHQIVYSIDSNRLTKLRFQLAPAISRSYLAAILQFTNVMSLDINTNYTSKSMVESMVNLLLNFPLLRDLTTTNVKLIKLFKGKYLTKLEISPSNDFDISSIRKFKQLQVLKISYVSDLTNADSLSQLTRLTSLILLKISDISESNFKAICRHTQLKHLEMIGIHELYPPTSISSLRNLTTLKLEWDNRVNWTETLAPLTALQHISLVAIRGNYFSPSLCSTLTHLQTFRFVDDPESHIFQLTSLQSLKMIASNDPSIYVKLRELQRLTRLTLWFEPDNNKMEVPYWTVLTQLLCLIFEHTESIDRKLCKQTKNRMPSVLVKWSKPPLRYH
jgi:hypothetical protein